MRKWNTVAIIGVGLIGGSIGLALRQRKLADRIVGIGRRSKSLEQAQSLGCVTDITTSVREGVREANLIIVCTPVESIAQHVVEAASACPSNCVITDAGSTKTQIVHDVEKAIPSNPAGRLAFVGSHPIAGSEKNGPEAAVAELFEQRVAVITPTANSDERVAEEIKDFWGWLGAYVVRMSPEEHDTKVAHLSHLPHLVSSALAAATPGHGDYLQLTGSGWTDTTRIAAGDPELWRQIFLANRGATLNALADFERVLNTWRHALERGDGQALTELLKEGKTRRDAVGN